MNQSIFESYKMKLIIPLSDQLIETKKALQHRLNHSNLNITVAEIHEPQRRKLEKFNVNITSETAHPSISQADVIFLCVKPDSIEDVASKLSKTDLSNKTIISAMVSLPLNSLKPKFIGQNINYIRIMPNVAISVSSGVVGVYAENPDSKSIIDRIFSGLSKVYYFDNESDLHKVTAISGSGIAYYYRFMESMIKAAREIGLQSEAEMMVFYTALGGAKMAIESGMNIQDLKNMVASKGGTTEKALLSFENDNLDKIVLNACQKVLEKCKEIENTA